MEENQWKQRMGGSSLIPPARMYRVKRPLTRTERCNRGEDYYAQCLERNRSAGDCVQIAARLRQERFEACLKNG